MLSGGHIGTEGSFKGIPAIAADGPGFAIGQYGCPVIPAVSLNLFQKFYIEQSRAMDSHEFRAAQFFLQFGQADFNPMAVIPHMKNRIIGLGFHIYNLVRF